MKKIFYFTAAVFLALLPGCFEDRGNYNYLTLSDVDVAIVSGTYQHNAKLGDHLNIPIKTSFIGTDIAESDLTYQWELKNSDVFIELPDQTARDFDRDLGPDDYFNNYTTYILRLRATWEFDGQQFAAYSPLVSVVISGEVGLMVMHGDASGVDIGMIRNNVFLVSAAASVQDKITYNNYSSINGGRIPGAGLSCMQLEAYTMANAWIYTFTDQGMTYTSPITFEKLGNYDDMFYSSPEFKFYKGKPEAMFFYNTSRVVIDGGDLFREVAPTKYIKRTEFTNATVPMTDYSFSKHGVCAYGKGNGYMASIFFDEIRRGFVRVTFGDPSTVSYYDSDKGLFNPNDMQADLLYFGWGGMSDNQNNFLGIFRDDADEVFIGEFKFDAPDKENDTFARFKYDIASLPGFEEAKFHGFGINNTMCYYATNDAVYQYMVMGESGIGTGKKLLLGTTGSATALPISGEITMMKVLRPSLLSYAVNSAYQYYGEMMIVGTYEGGEGVLYAILLDKTTGNAISYARYTGFDRIYDANLKTK